MKLTISPLKIFRILALIVLVLLFATVILRGASLIIKIFWDVEAPLDGLRPIFDVRYNDSSIATWYTSLMLMFCSILLAAIAAAKKRGDERYTLHWSALSI